MTNHNDQPNEEGERLRRFVEEIMPEPLNQKDAFDKIVEPTGAAEAHKVLDYIEAALLPAIRRMRGAEMGGSMSRSVPSADYIPTLTVETGMLRFSFEVNVIPMPSLVSFAWLELKESHYDFDLHHHRSGEHWDLAALYEGSDGYEWRFIPTQYQGMGTDLYHELPVATLPPLLPDNIRPFLDFILTRFVEQEQAWRQHWERLKEQNEEAG